MLPKELLIIISSYINYDTHDAIEIIQDASQIKFNENDYLSILNLKHPEVTDKLPELLQDYDITYGYLTRVLSKTRIFINKLELII
jgi:hypothetical protein